MFTPPLPLPSKGRGIGQTPLRIALNSAAKSNEPEGIPLPSEGNRKLGVSDWRPKGGWAKGLG